MARDFLFPAWLVVGGSGTKFSLLGLMVGASAIKFALRTKNGPKSAVCGVPGGFFAVRAWAPLVGPPGPPGPSELVPVAGAGQALGTNRADEPVGAQAAQRHPHDAHRDPAERRNGLVEDEHGDEQLQGGSQVL